MGLPAGRTNNLAGRPKGTKSKKAKEIREVVSQLITMNLDRLQDDIDAMEPKDRATFIERLLHYTLPKLQATALHNIEPEPEIQRNRPAWLDAAV